MREPLLAERQRDELAFRHPGWEIWYVRGYPGDGTWFARPDRRDGRREILNAGAPEHLAGLIAAAERAATSPAERALPGRQLPDRQLSDRQLPDRQLPDRQLPDRQLPGRPLPGRRPGTVQAPSWEPPASAETLRRIKDAIRGL